MSDLCFIRYEILSVIKCTRKIIFCWHTGTQMERSGVSTGAGENIKSEDLGTALLSLGLFVLYSCF